MKAEHKGCASRGFVIQSWLEIGGNIQTLTATTNITVLAIYEEEVFIISLVRFKWI